MAKVMFRDARTGVLYPEDVVQSWGRDGVGDGYGPEPLAFHLVERQHRQAQPDGSVKEMKVFEASRGELRMESVSDAAAATAEADFAKLKFARGLRWRGQVVGVPQVQ